MLFEEDRQQIIACLASLLELEDNDSEVSDLLDYLLTLSSQVSEKCNRISHIDLFAN